MALDDKTRQERYLQLCEDSDPGDSGGTKNASIEAPLFSWSARESLLSAKRQDHQHALLGHLLRDATKIDHDQAEQQKGDRELVLLNTTHPWSAFICGSQGSGKSYTTSCILEGCLALNDSIGTLQSPMSGLVFRYDRQGSGICEAAALCKGAAAIKVEVLVSPFSYQQHKRQYEAIKPANGMLEVKPFYIKSSYLNAERMQRFMASGDGPKPLYMNVVDRVIRELGYHNQGPHASGKKAFTYHDFKIKLDQENLTEAQKGPLDLRLSLISSYMKHKEWQGVKQIGKYLTDLEQDDKVEDTLAPKPGCLKILDLTDPNLDRAGACAMFDLALAAAIRSREPKIIALDEAHNYLSDAEGCDIFTESLLKTVREQRHTGTRVIITTQEPTISPKFLDLCNMTIVHRFTSPDWFRALRRHLGGASSEAGVGEEQAQELFRRIGRLRVGQSLLFSPTAILDVDDHGDAQVLEFRSKKMKTRKRLTEDGGESRLATSK